MMDWDSLSENELKRLVSQLEKTRDRLDKTPFRPKTFRKKFILKFLDTFPSKKQI
jgi:hypothetical protein